MKPLTFLHRHETSANGGWTAPGPDLERLYATLEDAMVGGMTVALKHWLYCGASSPETIILDEFEEVVAFLTEHAKAGDIIDLWLLEETKADFSFKCPNSEGHVPDGGAY